MKSETKLEKLILQLIRQTTEGNISWEATTAPRAITLGTDDLVQQYFETTYKDQIIAVFERRYKDYDGEHDLTYWNSRDCIAFLEGTRSVLSDNRSITWESSDHPFALSNLLKVAQESAADVDGILDSLLD